MKFTTREDIEAPVEEVFAAFADTGGWERALLRRGAEVSRTDRLTQFGPGMSWLLAFVWRGRMRKLTVRLDQVDAPHQLAFVITGNAIDARAVLDFVPLSARRARVALALDVKPRNLAARVFLQSLKLARAKVNGKFRARFAALCAEVEARLNPGLKMARR